MNGTVDESAGPTPACLRMARSRRDRIRAALRCGLYILFVVVLVAVALFVLQRVFHIRPDQSVTPPIGLLLSSECLLVLVTVVVPTALMTAITRDGPTSFGWGTGGRMRGLAIGVASGVAAMALTVGLIAACHGASVQNSSSTAGSLVRHGFLYLVIFALVAIAEEGLLRGYALVALGRAISFWPAAVVSSVAFALLHAAHGGETLSGIVHVAITGLLLSYSFWRTGGLWFACGWHAAWDFTETFVFGAPDSGMPARDSLLVTQLHGAPWLTGGSAGPEGSWLVLPVLALVALLVHLSLNHAVFERRR